MNGGGACLTLTAKDWGCKIGLCGREAERSHVRASKIVPSGRSQLQWILHLPLLSGGDMQVHVGVCKRGGS